MMATATRVTAFWPGVNPSAKRRAPAPPAVDVGLRRREPSEAHAHDGVERVKRLGRPWPDVTWVSTDAWVAAIMASPMLPWPAATWAAWLGGVGLHVLELVDRVEDAVGEPVGAPTTAPEEAPAERRGGGSRRRRRSRRDGGDHHGRASVRCGRVIRPTDTARGHGHHLLDVTSTASPRVIRACVAPPCPSWAITAGSPCPHSLFRRDAD